MLLVFKVYRKQCKLNVCCEYFTCLIKVSVGIIAAEPISDDDGRVILFYFFSLFTCNFVF